METIYLDAPDERDPCHLLVAHRTVLGAWLQAPLTSAVGLLMDDDVLVAMVALEFQCVNHAHKCHRCGQMWTSWHYKATGGPSTFNQLTRSSLPQQRFVPFWSPQEFNAQMIRNHVGLLGCHGSMAELYELYANCLNTFANLHVALGPGRQKQWQTELKKHLGVSCYILCICCSGDIRTFRDEAISLPSRNLDNVLRLTQENLACFSTSYVQEFIVNWQIIQTSIYSHAWVIRTWLIRKPDIIDVLFGNRSLRII